MGAKSKKAPSGNRARRKAKLDNRWGEEEIEDNGESTGYKRGSKLQNRHKRNQSSNEVVLDEKQEIQPTIKHEGESSKRVKLNSYDDDFESREETNEEDGVEALSKLLQKIDKQRKRNLLTKKQKRESDVIQEQFIGDDESSENMSNADDMIGSASINS